MRTCPRFLPDRIAGIFHRLRTLNHHNGIGAGRHGRAGGDVGDMARRDVKIRQPAGRGLTDDRVDARTICRDHRVPVFDGSGKGRQRLTGIKSSAKIRPKASIRGTPSTGKRVACSSTTANASATGSIG